MFYKNLFFALFAAFLAMALPSCGSKDEDGPIGGGGAAVADEAGAADDETSAADDQAEAEAPLEGVCGRSPAMQEAILSAVRGWFSWFRSGLLGREPKDCSQVTAEDLSEIRNLSLSDKGLTEFDPQELSGMEGLRALYLHNNGLTSFPTDWIKDFPSLRFVGLRGNSFSYEERQRLTNLSKERKDFSFAF